MKPLGIGARQLAGDFGQGTTMAKTDDGMFACFELTFEVRSPCQCKRTYRKAFFTDVGRNFTQLKAIGFK